MSELKEHIFCDIDEVFPRGYCGSLPSHEARPYYLKSEADKVIAGLKSEIERLEILCANYRHDCDNLAISNEQASRAARTLLKKMNYNKYKRCLRNAEGCLYKVWYYNEVHDRNASNRMWKWRQRWLELAEKFKEVK